MSIVCNIWMICLELNWLFYDPSWMLQHSEFIWALRSLVWVVFINFLRIDATDGSKISSDQKRLFFAVSLYPLSFFTNTPFKIPVSEVSSLYILVSENLNGFNEPFYTSYSSYFSYFSTVLYQFLETGTSAERTNIGRD